MKKAASICIFDTETIPDVETLRQVYGYAGDDESVAQEAFSRQKERTGSEFLPICFHKVVAISAVMADSSGKILRASSIGASGEYELLEKFITFLNSQNPRLVSFNGRGFDLPMLMLRAMRYNLSCHSYFDTSDPSSGKDKWCNYRSRYDGAFHLDLADHIGEFGAVRGLGLDAICKSLNIPGKYDTHGDEVWRLHLQNKDELIREYCESDAINTYWLFLKYELLRGNISQEQYGENLQALIELMQTSSRGYGGVFGLAASKELARLSGDLDYESDEEPAALLDEARLEETLQGLGVYKGGANLKQRSKVEPSQYEESLPEIDIDSQ